MDCERLKREIKARIYGLRTKDPRGLRAINEELIRRGLQSPKEMSTLERLNILRPSFQEFVDKIGEPIKMGTNLGFMFGVMQTFGQDAVATLIEENLIEPHFDYEDRFAKKTRTASRGGMTMAWLEKVELMSLPDYLRQEAIKTGWKQD